MENNKPSVEFKYGDLYVECSKGHKTKIGENINTGLQLLLINREDSYIEVSCPECDKEYKITMRTHPAENPPVEIEDVVEEIIEETNEEIEYELQEDIVEGQDV